MAERHTSSTPLLVVLLLVLVLAPAVVSAHRHLHDDGTDAATAPGDGATDAAAATQAALGAPAEFDPTPRPLNFDPAQAGKSSGFYRCVHA
jgi:myo-inositol catabolism protein IolC